ncbi:carbonic anhydrase [Evansella halocellulosilytica]|uniref:carbonic anhydrase n=1 Tax=Evansella halocellulosilytica TaxID=2011013 RepID=UPI00211C4A52|nr:carbonic anhydrase [Evansella halocellulosilytica]
MTADILKQRNREFVKHMNEVDPDFFSKLKEGQSPDFFILSCSDSRVSPTTITGMTLGSMFIHRNVANQVNHRDDSFSTGLYFALHYLKVSYIIIIGHTGCGGVEAAWGESKDEKLQPWLSHIQESLPMEEKNKSFSSRDLSIQNVLSQVENMKNHPIYMEHGQGIPVIGMVFNLGTGELEYVTEEEQVDQIKEIGSK